MANVSLRSEALNPALWDINSNGFFQAGIEPGKYEDAIKVEAIQSANGQSVRQTAYATVTIATIGREAPIVRVDVVPQEITLSAGRPFAFRALSYDAYGNPVAAVRYDWQIQNADAGSISSFGFFRATDALDRYEDAINVTALQTLEGQTVKKEAFVTITVVSRLEDAPLARVEILPQRASIPNGYSLAFIAVAYDSQGNPLPGVDFRWQLEDSQAGTINSSGYFRGEGEPREYKDTIRVEAVQDYKGERMSGIAFASVTLISPATLKGSPLEQVVVVPQEVVLNPGQPFNFSAVAYDALNNPLFDVQFSWSLEKPQLGTISTRGLFKAGGTSGRHLGSIRVEAFQVLNGKEIKREAYADLIISGHVSRVEVSPSSTTIAGGEAVAFFATAYDEQSIAIPGLSYTWKLLDPRAGTLSRAGIFIAGDEPGEYLNAIEVEARQVYPDTSP